MERVASEIAVLAEKSSLISGAEALCRIFDDFQTVLFCDGEDRVDLAGHTGVIHRYNDAGLVRNGIFDLLFIDVHRIGANVDKYECCASLYKCVCC